MKVLRKKYWNALVFGVMVALASGLAGGRELDGAPASIKTWGFPLPWLKRVGPTKFFPSIPVRWSIAVPVVCFPLNALFWSLPMFLILRWRFYNQTREMARRQAAGLCEWCGYDLRGSPGSICPECGVSRK